MSCKQFEGTDLPTCDAAAVKLEELGSVELVYQVLLATHILKVAALSVQQRV